jgi:eukaryotic-like serine/threonine-protein kinase
MSQRVVAGRFVLHEALGHGGMGTVWRAEDQVLGRTVALKEVSLPPSVPEEERQAMRQRVLREARAAARLNHPAAVTVFDVIEEGDTTFIAMEIVDSPTLYQLVSEQGPITPERTASIAIRVLDALQAAHAQGIVHRDVKPANVMVGDEQIKLADFGIATVKGDPRLTATGLLLGSPSYMSPEQVDGKAAGSPSDLWALGATMYFAVEGQGPFDRPGPLPTLLAISKEKLNPPAHAGPLAPAIVSLLNKDPAARPVATGLRPMLEEVAGVPVGEAEPVLTEEAPERLDEGADLFVAGAGLSKAIPSEPDLVGPGPTETAEGGPGAPGPEVEVLASLSEEDTRTWPDELPGTRTITKPGPLEPAPVHEDRAEPVPSTAVEGAAKRPYLAFGAVAVVIALALFLVLPRLGAGGSVTPDEPSAPAPAEDGGNGAQGAGGEGADGAPGQPGADGQDGADGRDGTEGRRGVAGGGEPSALPAGWRSVDIGSTGFRIGVPPGWRVTNNALGDGSSMRLVGESGRYLLVDWTNRPGRDAVAAWEEQAADYSRRHDNYRQIRIEPTTFRDFPTAAVWEWTYSSGGADLHAVNLGFADDDWGMALNFQTRTTDWRSSADTFETFKSTFGRG